MKKMTKMAVLPVVMALGVGFSSMASASYNCDAKRSAIEYQIQQAEKYGNYNRVAGLKRALSEVNARCSTGGAVIDLQKKVEKLERKLLDKKEDVRDVKADLREARAKGDAKKVAKYQRKLQEKQAEVKEVAAELRQAKAELAAARK
ncbi:DUF1090 domain-containing protein [Serratia rubidaea]|uniref:DUF1090 domain-containing protein n=1 Tax=Serratia rubidaea TaxID=61652 RepID=UPI0022B8A3CA|nr:DUF1090 domain-containing protein [Serratia rubidaea]WBF46233.1 DUF1090 domain-containing protein [Serratia rubidaea]